jgi:hypothetical protein
MTNHHLEAWEHVKKHLFGEVVEVARTTPWGFKEDRSDILNLSVEDFLTNDIQTDTIILHILSGEGEDPKMVEAVVKKAMKDCVKLVILEHNPQNVKVPDIQYIKDLLPEHITEDWGRNMLFTCTTMGKLVLNELSDDYVKEHLDKTYVTPKDEGIDTKLLVYTHTSEVMEATEIPKGIVWWVIGGGLAYEQMRPENRNILIDSVLRQVLHCAYRYGVEYWKLHRIWDKVADVEYAVDYKQWRKVTPNDVLPDEIRHIALQNLDCEGDTVYVSTVHKDYWKHLEANNNILDGWTKRDHVQLKMV